MKRIVGQQRHSFWHGLIILIAALPLSASLPAAADVSGNVFRDYNADGADGSEPGVEGTVVTVFNDAGASCQTTTDAAGDYTVDTDTCDGGGPLSPGAANEFRVEFTLPGGGSLDFLEPGAAGGTTVQFVDVSGGDVTGVDAGLNAPSDYCQGDPLLSTTCFVDADLPADAALVNFLESEVSDVPVDGDVQVPLMTETAAAVQSEVGTVWGLAWQPATASLFSAAFVKFLPNHPDPLPNGPGAIYRTDLGGGGSSLFVTIAGVGTYTGAQAEVGVIGLGDLEISNDGDTLYTINLNTKELVTIPLIGDPPTPGIVTTTALPTPSAAECAAANVHPFALGVHQGKIYVGMTCGAPAANLRAWVYELDGGTFTQKINLPFTYGRPTTNTFWRPTMTQYLNNNQSWIDWNTYDVVMPTGNSLPARSQPWLTDLEFDNGDMILGIRSRMGDATILASTVKGGDILRACADSATVPTTWTMENNGTCGGITPTLINPDPWTANAFAAANSLGPGGREYYWNDDGYEGEATQGALVQIPGRPDVVVSEIDALGHFHQHGVMRLGNTSGLIAGAGNVFFGDGFSQLNKANGLGDLEALCDAAPIEIGNRVWMDDGDGIQDPGEMPLAGVTVNLSCDGGALTATTVTDAAGQWLFNDANVAGGLVPGHLCTVRLDNPADYGPGMPLEDKIPTAVDQGTDLHDNDSTTVMGFPEIGVTIGDPGENNHTYDFGMELPAPGVADLGDNPDSYGTTIGAGGASHVIVPGYSLGPTEDDEPDGQPSAGADGDDTNGIDDEDGVMFAGGMAMATACSTGNGLQVSLTDTAGVGSAFLDAWIDFDGDGLFDHPAEHLFGGVSVALAVGTNGLSYDVPCTAQPQPITYSRFRLSSTGGLTPIGSVLDGEVEDYLFQIKGLDFGDAPDPTYPVLLASDGARHPVLPVDNPTLGAVVDTEPDGQPSADHTGDDASGTPDDEDGVLFFGDLQPGVDNDVDVTAGATGGTLNAWIDFNADGDWDDAGEQIAVDVALAANTTITLLVAVPADAAAGLTCSRFRFSSQPGLTPTGVAMDGEVEDHLVSIEPEIPIIEIPTLGGWGLASMVMLLAAGALGVLRRRRVKGRR